MRALARVFTPMCIVFVQDEQSPLAGILLANRLQDTTDLFFLLVFRELYHTLTVESVESHGRIVCLN